MFCGKCGSPIPDGNSFCGKCGAPIADSSDQSVPLQQEQPVQAIPVIMSSQPAKRTNGAAIAGFILGIISALLCLVPVVGMVLGIVGFVLSIVGISKKGEYSGGGLAIAGLLLSLVGVMGLIMTLGVNAYIKKSQTAASQSAYKAPVSTSATTMDINKEIDMVLG